MMAKPNPEPLVPRSGLHSAREAKRGQPGLPPSMTPGIRLPFHPVSRSATPLISPESPAMLPLEYGPDKPSFERMFPKTLRHFGSPLRSNIPAIP